MPGVTGRTELGDLIGVDRGEDTSKVVVEQALERDVARNLDSSLELLGHQIQKTTRRHRSQSEHHDFRKTESSGKTDGVGVTRSRRFEVDSSADGFDGPTQKMEI